MPLIYDVIVAGAGPAGATAAYLLGEAGRRVLVLEKEALPRYKTCGGGLSQRFLERQFPFSFEPVLQTEVTAFRYDFGRHSVTIPVQKGSVGMVMRAQLDAHILAHARAETRQETAVRHVTETANEVIVETRDGSRYASRYLVGADGANSIVARQVGLRRKKLMAAAIEAEAPASPEVMQRLADTPVFIFGDIKLGYLWIFPKPDHLSVGIAALHPARGELQAILQRVMQRYNISLEDVQLHGHPIPIYNRREPVSTRRVLLVGDAAGLADPLSGEGIRYAIKSGQLASQAILSNRPDTYAQMIYQAIGRHHQRTTLTAQAFYHFQHLCLLLGAPNPFTTQAIIDLLSDRASASDVMLRGIFTFPIYLAVEIIAGAAGLLGNPDRRDWVRSAFYSNVRGLAYSA